MRGRIALVVLTAALAAPADALAVDHVWLTLNATKLGDGWTLTGSSASGDFYPNGKEILGVTLNHRVSAVRTDRHALRAALVKATVSFDGRRGRWQARNVNDALTVNMAIAATGSAVEVGEVLGCRGSFARVPVMLTGTFALRTGTKLLQTIRRTRLRAQVTYNKGGEVACGPVATGCETEEWLTASTGQRQLIVSLTQRTLTLSFPEAGWYQVLERREVTVSGDLPTIRVAAGRLGSMTFTATKTVEGGGETCRIVSAEGRLEGTLRVRFAGWGARSFKAASAQYRRIESA